MQPDYDYWWSSKHWCDIPLDEVGMKIRLLHFGALRSESNPLHKHRMRQEFHRQLSVLWGSTPLLEDIGNVAVKSKNPTTGEDQYITRIDNWARDSQRGEFGFVPLVNRDLGLACSIDVLLLRREEPGMLPTLGGDIDNRFKPLLDALQMPSLKELPSGATPGPGEKPFFCLLEDDGLLTDFRVRADRLLRSWDLPMSDDLARKLVFDAAGELYQNTLTGLSIPSRETWEEELQKKLEIQSQNKRIENEVMAVITVTPLIAIPGLAPIEFIAGV